MVAKNSQGSDDPREEGDSWAWEQGEESDAGRPRSGGLGELLRKIAASGVGAAFMTEEGIRRLVREMKLPKEAVGFFADQAERSKDEILRILGEEVRRFLRSPALRKELLDLLSEMTVEVEAKIRLKPGALQVEVGNVEVRAPSAQPPKAEAEGDEPTP